MPNRRVFLALSGWFAPALGVAACASTRTPPSTRSTAGRDTVTYLTGYQTNPREMFPHVGIQKGFFAEVGIELTVLPGQPSDFNLKALEAGKAQFASVDFVSAVRGVRTFHGFRAVAPVQENSLLSMMALEESHISQPTDLNGKTLGTVVNAASKTLFPTYARLAGIDLKTIRMIDGQPDAMAALLAAHRVDAVGAYATDVPNYQAAAQGKKVVALPYSKYLTDLYGGVLITTTGLLNNNRGLVERFTSALVRTVRYAVDHPDEAGAIIHARLPVIKAEVVLGVLTLMKPYVGSALLDPVRVMRGIALLESAGLAMPGTMPEQVVDFDVAKKAVQR
jgi:NitT/TauT family transport system substrate-binding protein